MSSTKYIDTEIEVDLSEWDSAELHEELMSRGDEPPNVDPLKERLERLYLAITSENDAARDLLLRELIYSTIGRILP